MIEAYAFLTMFTTQILAMSILYPAWFISYLRRQATRIPAERVEHLYAGVDSGLAREQFFTRYHALNTAITVIGLLLLFWLFNYLRRFDWSIRAVEVLVGAYFMLQTLVPLGFVVWRGLGFNRNSLLEAKRKAVLKPRGLFDFVSPSSVFLAALSYFLFVAFVISIQQHPAVALSGLIDIGAITLVYGLQAFVVHAMLYGKKPNPFESHAGRAHTIGLVVKSCVYSCIACVVFFALNITLGLLDLQRWMPFALSAFFVITALLSLMGMLAPRPPGSAGNLEIRSLPR